MSTEEPPTEQAQPVSPQTENTPTDPSKQHKEKRKKKKKKKKNKKSLAKANRSSRNNPKSYGAGPRFARRESTPHHATVQSLASINQPIIVNKLSKMSQDLKYQRELKKALTELRQKDEDYRYAIEIGESLTKENEYLKEQVEIVESQLHHQHTVNMTLKEKLETLSSTYHQDLYKYHQELQKQKEMVHELRGTLQHKQQELQHKQQEINQQEKRMNQRGHRDVDQGSGQRTYRRMNSDDFSNLQNGDFGSGLEKQLYMQLDKEKKKGVEQQQNIEDLMKKLEDVNGLKKKYDTLKKANKELKQITKDELAQHIQMQKSIEAEAIYLAAKTANLEEERESLLNLLDQRDYELTMLNNQLALQKKALSINQNMESTLGDDIGSDDEYYEYADDMDNMDSEEDDQMLDDKDEIDIIAEILDDEDLFDSDNDDDDNDNDNHQTQSKRALNKYGNEGQTQTKNNNIKKRPQESEESRDKKAFDKIKEYLHLTASAVKIKYPTVKDIQSDELIKRVRELPFYKYHDQMVRIIETQIRDDKKKTMKKPALSNNNSELETEPPTLNKRKSFLSIFNIFGNDDGKSNEQSDNEDMDDNKSDGGMVSDNENDNEDAGISNRRKRSGSKRRKKKSKKKKHRKSLTSDNEVDTSGVQKRKGSDVSSGIKYKRGMLQASAKRLKNT